MLRRPGLGIAVEAGRVRATLVRKRRIVWAAEAIYASPADLVEVLAALVAERPTRVTSARVTLGASVVTVKTIAGLPPLGRDDLAAHVRLRSRRYFLQNGVPLVTDAAPVLVRGRATRDSLIAAVEAPLVEAIASGLAGAGLTCDSIAPAEFALQLLPDALRETHRQQGKRMQRWLWSACAASLLAAVGSWLLTPLWHARTAGREMDRIRPVIRSALAVRADLDAATEALDLVAAAQAKRSHHARLLADLARTLPDSAFLAAIRLDRRGGTLSGYAPRASRVLTALERRTVVAPSLDGPVTREVVGGLEWERFSIRFQAQP